MKPIAVLTGSPGTGKTTVAALLAQAAPRGVHLPSDIFFTFPAHPIPPYRPAASEQNADLMMVLARTAAAFAFRGYDVFMEGIFGPWFLPLLARELLPTGIPLDYVVLSAPLETALERVRSREGEERSHIVRQMHAAFAELGRYAEHVVDTAGRTAVEVAEEVSRRRAGGTFTVDLAAAAASEPRAPEP